MRRPFFKPIPVTFTERIRRPISDEDLLRAWGGVSPADIRALPLDGLHPEGRKSSKVKFGTSPQEAARTRRIRARVIALKEAGHA